MSEFYVRTGHQGRHGHEFLEFEYDRGRLRYANNSNYRNDSLILWISPLMVQELKRIVEESEILKYVAKRLHDREDDAKWPKKNVVGRQELEIRLGKEHISFELGSLVEVQNSDDPEGLRVMYYLVQDLKVRTVNTNAQCLIFSLISLHFKIKPISV